MDITTTVATEITSNSAKSGGTITGDPGDYAPIVDRLLMNKFQLYNKSRQKITSELKNTGSLKPLQMFIDSNQSNKSFVLGGFRYNPCTDIYNVEFFEYDNTSVITLNG